MFSCLLFTVMYTMISIISFTILILYMGLVLFLDKNLFARVHRRVPVLLFLLCRYVEAEPLGTKTKVLSKYTSTYNKKNNNIARGHMGYRWRDVIWDCRI